MFIDSQSVYARASIGGLSCYGRLLLYFFTYLFRKLEKRSMWCGPKSFSRWRKINGFNLKSSRWWLLERWSANLLWELFIHVIWIFILFSYNTLANSLSRGRNLLLVLLIFCKLSKLSKNWWKFVWFSRRANFKMFLIPKALLGSLFRLYVYGSRV